MSILKVFLSNKKYIVRIQKNYIFLYFIHSRKFIFLREIGTLQLGILEGWKHVLPPPGSDHFGQIIDE